MNLPAYTDLAKKVDTALCKPEHIETVGAEDTQHQHSSQQGQALCLEEEYCLPDVMIVYFHLQQYQ